MLAKARFLPERPGEDGSSPPEGDEEPEGEPVRQLAIMRRALGVRGVDL